MEFTIYYEYFPILRGAPRTTRCHATHGIYNISSTFSYPRERSEDHSMPIKPRSLQYIINIFLSCNALNLQYIINIFLSSGEVRGPLDVDQTMEFAIYCQHFPVLGGAPRTTRCHATQRIYNILLTCSYCRERSKGPPDVDQTVEFAIDYQHFPILRGAPRTTRCRSTRRYFVWGREGGGFV